MKRRRLRRPPSGGLFDRPRSVKLTENNNGGHYATHAAVGNGAGDGV